MFRFKTVVLLTMVFFVAGCASVENRQDPLESMNRAVFEFNEVLDENVMEPVARGYEAIVPQPIRMVIGNFFSNLNDIVVTGNSLLQLKFDDALAGGTRILINTTFGMLGMIDIASDISEASDIAIHKRDEDFGQTLGYYGVPSGPYLVLPLMGPSSFRDATGLIVDGYFADPITGFYLNDNAGIKAHIRDIDDKYLITAAGVRLIDARAELLGIDTMLEEAALDKYEFMRDAYFQSRNSLVHDGNVPEAIFEDFEDFED